MGKMQRAQRKAAMHTRKVGAAYAANQAFQTQSPEVVAHPARGELVWWADEELQGSAQ
jgi:hypothetical protein